MIVLHRDQPDISAAEIECPEDCQLASLCVDAEVVDIARCEVLLEEVVKRDRRHKIRPYGRHSGSGVTVVNVRLADSRQLSVASNEELDCFPRTGPDTSGVDACVSLTTQRRLTIQVRLSQDTAPSQLTFEAKCVAVKKTVVGSKLHKVAASLPVRLVRNPEILK